MRKLIVSEFVSLDGVMQAPGGLDKDREGVSRTLEKPIWRNTTIIRDDVIESVRALKAQPGKNILTDGSSQLVHALIEHDLVDELHLLVYPLVLGSGKRALPSGVHTTFALKSAEPYPSGVVGLTYGRRPVAG